MYSWRHFQRNHEDIWNWYMVSSQSVMWHNMQVQPHTKQNTSWPELPHHQLPQLKLPTLIYIELIFKSQPASPEHPPVAPKCYPIEMTGSLHNRMQDVKCCVTEYNSVFVCYSESGHDEMWEVSELHILWIEQSYTVFTVFGRARTGRVLARTTWISTQLPEP